MSTQQKARGQRTDVPSTHESRAKRDSNWSSILCMHNVNRPRRLSLASNTKAGNACRIATTMADSRVEVWNAPP